MRSAVEVRTGLSEPARRQWAETYAKTNYRDLPWFSTEPYPWIVRAVRERWAVPPGPVLDIGCGAGTNALWLAGRHFRVTGVDISPGAIAAAERRRARRRVPATFQVGDALRLPFQDRSFRYATDVGCFHTLPEDRRPDYAAEVARVLRPRGAFFLSWIAREETRELGPPNRLSLEEVVREFEPEFVVAQSEFAPLGAAWAPARRHGRLASYRTRLVRRAFPQPGPHEPSPPAGRSRASAPRAATVRHRPRPR